MPQAFGSPGGQKGTGSELGFGRATGVLALEVAVKALAPASVRVKTEARMMFFMVILL